MGHAMSWREPFLKPPFGQEIDRVRVSHRGTDVLRPVEVFNDKINTIYFGRSQ